MCIENLLITGDFAGSPLTASHVNYDFEGPSLLVRGSKNAIFFEGIFESNSHVYYPGQTIPIDKGEFSKVLFRRGQIITVSGFCK